MDPSLAHLIAAHQHTLSFHFAWTVPGFLALIAGILAFVRPKNFNQIIVGYLVLLALWEIFGFSF